MKRTPIAALIVALGLGSVAFADSIVFNNPSGDLGSSTHTYTLDGVSIIASGFNGATVANPNGDLFGKNGGGDENGLGFVADPSGDDEIYLKASGTQDFIQLDMINLLNAGFKNIMFQMGSSSGNDAWSVSACSVSGTDCGTGAFTGSDELFHTALTVTATNHFLDFSATGGNVLLGSIAATPSVPEPQFYGVFAIAMLALGVVVLRKRRSVSA
jgi:hypothetical protein